jgi:hypothetical protein
MSRQSIRISFTGGKVVSINDTLMGAVEMISTNETLKKYYVLKLSLPDAGLILYFDDHAFLQYNQGDITYDELIERTQCDELYRNWLEINTGNDIVEPGALWMLKGNTLTLIDEDRFISITFDKEAFEIAT